LVLALVLPGACILLLAPAILAALRPAGRLAPALAGLFAVALWTPLAPALTDALGLSAVLVGAVVGFTWTVLAPICSEEPGEKIMSYATWSFVLIALVAAVLAGRAPRVDPDHPARVNLIHLTDLDTGRAWHVAEAATELPEALASAHAWDGPRPLLPWSTRPVFATSAAPIDAAGPTLERRPPGPADPPGSATATLRARPGAVAALLVLPAGAVSSLTVGGEPLVVADLRPGPSDTRIVTVYGPPAEGVEIAATLVTPAPWTVVDLVLGLAPDGPAEQRPDIAVPYQWGDLLAAYRVVQP
ncbi:MAG TPA: hypothetical protein VIK91_20895, partial [Nannocystis sp.]